jgi:ribosomal protein L34E
MKRKPSARSALAARVAALEERVSRLERGRPPPGDGRTTHEARAGREGARCAGCGLPLRRRRGRCAECGRPLDADAG